MLPPPLGQASDHREQQQVGGGVRETIARLLASEARTAFDLRDVARHEGVLAALVELVGAVCRRRS